MLDDTSTTSTIEYPGLPITYEYLSSSFTEFPLRRQLFLQFGEWTAVLRNGSGGAGILHRWFADRFDGMFIRAVDVAGVYPCVSLEVYGLGGDDCNCLRVLVSADDSGEMVNTSYGEPFSFELDNDVGSFTADRLHRYLNELGVPNEPIEQATRAVLLTAQW